MNEEKMLETEVKETEEKEAEVKIVENEDKWSKVKNFLSRHKKKLIVGAVGASCVGGMVYLNHLSKTVDFDALPEGDSDSEELQDELEKENKDEK